MKNNTRKEIAAFAVLILLCLAVMFWALDLGNAVLKVPFGYAGDAKAIISMMKGVIDNGWFLQNPFVGAPGTLDWRDYPIADNFSFLVVWMISLFSSKFGVVFNLFLLLNYLLTAVTAWFVFRHFRLNYYVSACGALLYSFLPFHMSRSLGHVMYSVYFAVPLVVMIAIWVMAGELSLESRKEDGRRFKRRLAVCLIACLLVASTGGFYFAFFGSYLILMAAIFAAIEYRSIRQLVMPISLICFIVLTLAINVSPSLIHLATKGNINVVERSPADAEIFGSKLAQLLLPIDNHRLRSFAFIKRQYQSNPLINENSDSTLGIVGATGFVTLLCWLLFRRRKNTESEAGLRFEIFDHLSILNIAAFLLSTIGGIGSLFALFVSPAIRGYNRIVVYIAFISILASMIMLEKALARLPRGGWRGAIGPVLTLLLLCIGLLDQVTNHARPNHLQLKNLFYRDQQFVQQIENRLPPGAMIFQLPFVQFPESRPPVRMQDYDHFLGYMYSQKLRWSYGAMKGRYGDLWQQEISGRPAPEMIEAVARSGFTGIWVDRFGYQDAGAGIEREIAAITGAQPAVNWENRISFFDIRDYINRLKSAESSEAWQAKFDATAHPVLAAWGLGCSGIESNEKENWRWCAHIGKIRIINDSSQPKRIIFEASFNSSNDSTLTINSAFLNEKLSLKQQPLEFSREILVPPGEHTLEFNCNGKPAYAPGDPRVLVFRVNNFILRNP